MVRLFSEEAEVAHSWCDKTTTDDHGRNTPPKDWRTCQMERCPWRLFERRSYPDGEHRMLCRENKIHGRFG